MGLLVCALQFSRLTLVQCRIRVVSHSVTFCKTCNSDLFRSISDQRGSSVQSERIKTPFHFIGVSADHEGQLSWYDLRREIVHTTGRHLPQLQHKCTRKSRSMRPAGWSCTLFSNAILYILPGDPKLPCRPKDFPLPYNCKDGQVQELLQFYIYVQ